METALSTPATHPIYLSKEQFCKLCHISKATALRLIKSGTVPAIDTGKKTNRYLIAQSDIEAYLHERVRNPFRFTTGSQHHIQAFDEYRDFNRENAIKLRKIAEFEWLNQPDILKTSDVSMLLGYRTNTIYKWRKTLGLNGYIIAGKLYFPKICLLDFVASAEFQSIQRKSIKHMSLLRRAIHAGT